ncbi:MAG: hypothetical protein NT099_05920 [Candidatus Saganbacteria bacterium]|nr:hypothetical protein [Candidatus Saganbacteria bacterium]
MGDSVCINPKAGCFNPWDRSSLLKAGEGLETETTGAAVTTGTSGGLFVTGGTVNLPEDPTPILQTDIELARQRALEKFSGAVRAFLKMVWVTGREFVDTNLKDLAGTFSFLPQDQASRNSYLDSLYSDINASNPNIDKYVKESLALMDRGLANTLKDLQDNMSQPAYDYLGVALKEELQKLEEMKPFKALKLALAELTAPLKGVQDKIQELKARIENPELAELGGQPFSRLKADFEFAVTEYDTTVIKPKLEQLKALLEHDVLSPDDQSTAQRLMQELREAAVQFEQKLVSLGKEAEKVEALVIEKQAIAAREKPSAAALFLRDSYFRLGLDLSIHDGPYLYPVSGGVQDGETPAYACLTADGRLRLNWMPKVFSTDVLAAFGFNFSDIYLRPGGRLNWNPLKSLALAFEGTYEYRNTFVDKYVSPFYPDLSLGHFSLMGRWDVLPETLSLSAAYKGTYGTRHTFESLKSEDYQLHLGLLGATLDIGRYHLLAEGGLGGLRRTSSSGISSSVDGHPHDSSGSTAIRDAFVATGRLRFAVDVPANFLLYTEGELWYSEYASQDADIFMWQAKLGAKYNPLQLWLEGFGGQGTEELNFTDASRVGVRAGWDPTQAFLPGSPHHTPITLQYQRDWMYNHPKFAPDGQPLDMFTLNLAYLWGGSDPYKEAQKSALEKQMLEEEKTMRRYFPKSAATVLDPMVEKAKTFTTALDGLETRAAAIEQTYVDLDFTVPAEKTAFEQMLSDVAVAKKRFEVGGDLKDSTGLLADVQDRIARFYVRIQFLLFSLTVKKDLEGLKAEWTNLQAQEKAGARVDWPAFVGKVTELQANLQGLPPDVPQKAALEAQIQALLGEAKKKSSP